MTLVDVALHAGVSAQTVSRAIRNPIAVSQTTLERVRASIAFTDYVPDLTANNLAPNQSLTVSAIVPSMSTSGPIDAIESMSMMLSPHGYHLLVGSTGHDSRVEGPPPGFPPARTRRRMPGRNTPHGRRTRTAWPRSRTCSGDLELDRRPRRLLGGLFVQ